MYKFLITGGRDYADYNFVAHILNSAKAHFKDNMAICQGGAKGADALAKLWAQRNGVPCFQCDSNWNFYGKRAGMLRNQWMLDFFKPDYVLAFPGGRGTAGMVEIAKKANVTVHQYGN